MSRQVLVFRHMDGDTPGRLSDLFAAAGYAVETVDLHRGQAIPALERSVETLTELLPEGSL